MIAALLCALVSWTLFLTVDSLWVAVPCLLLDVLGLWLMFGGGEHWLLRRDWAARRLARQRAERDR